SIRPIDDPMFVTAEEAEPEMLPTEFVIGLDVGGETKAYPVNVLSRHEIVNDEIGGTPVAVTFCPLCYTGLVFDRRVEGEELTFGVSGQLIMNNLVMWDRQTESLWLQITGEGIEGANKGQTLARVAHTQTTWEAWRDAHPETLVLDKRGGYGGDAYGGYYDDGRKGVLGESHEDDRLPPKDLVVGYIAGSNAKGYPFRTLVETPVINDEFEGDEIVVLFDDRSQTGQIFRREVDGRTLTFSLLERTRSDIVLSDFETGTTWSGITGEALSGPLSGERLDSRPSFYAFWFAWSDFFLEAELYEG
ncbi:MAG: DUF3179 domain-containing protein, partial [Gemmatimonadetes bacterium]|nr:DUF3179 domain-containing protein [Gemmatimonadota bacterium]